MQPGALGFCSTPQRFMGQLRVVLPEIYAWTVCIYHTWASGHTDISTTMGLDMHTLAGRFQSNIKLGQYLLLDTTGKLSVVDGMTAIHCILISPGG